ncbi:MAG: ABC transporter permease [Rhodococcus sp. (in: high G+C Gram-positive bacteria)]|uniref:ABC transporter permease n=1 Tax=Rhodococcus sp. TaxID=1831 RepID=UPI003BAE2EF5
MTTTALAELAATAPSGSPEPAKTSTPSQLGPRLRRILSVIGPPALLVVLFIAGWELMASRLDSPLVPALSEIGGELVDFAESGKLWLQLQVTLIRVLLGFALAFVVAVILGIAMGRNEFIRRFFEPLVVLGLVTPGLVKALLCVIWFGTGLINPIIAVALAAVPPLIISITQGVTSVDSDLHEMAYIYKLNAWTRFTRLWIPALAPALFAGGRLGIALAWKVIVLIEIFGLASGVGYQLNLEFSQHNVAGVLAWTAAFAIVMTAIEYGIFQTLEKRASRWRRGVNV